MRDYAELVKAWQYCTVSKTCDGCPMQKNCPEISHQIVAADAIEELLKENGELENSGRVLMAAFARLKEKVPHWISVEERLPDRINPLHARDTYLVRLKSGCIKTLFYEYDNSDRCRPGMSPLFSEGWEKTASPVTHWMSLPEPPEGGGVMSRVCGASMTCPFAPEQTTCGCPCAELCPGFVEPTQCRATTATWGNPVRTVSDRTEEVQDG